MAGILPPPPGYEPLPFGVPDKESDGSPPAQAGEARAHVSAAKLNGGFHGSRLAENESELQQQEEVAEESSGQLDILIRQDPALFEPLPWSKLYSLYFVCGSDAAVLMVIAPFLPEFCEKALGISPRNVGSAAGLISSAYSFANGFASPYVGHWSDLYGRKPVLLFGLLTSFVTTLTFAFCTKLWQATLCRGITGLLNSNFSVARAFLADVTRNTSPNDRASAFGYLGATWGVSRLLSASVAGATVGITLAFLPGSLGTNNYLMPCIFVSLLQCASFIVALVFLPETSPQTSRNDEACRKETDGQEMSAVQHLNSKHVKNSAEQPRRSSPSSILSRCSHLRAVGGWPLVGLICINALHSFANGANLLIMVLIWSLAAEHGGYGFGASLTSFAFAVFGLLGLVFQLASFSHLSMRLGARKVYSLGCFLLVLGSFTIAFGHVPLTRLSVGNPRWWATLMAILLPNSIGFMLGLPVLGGILSNSVPTDVQGLTQGVAQLFAQIGRCAGPLVCGLLFSASVAHARPWWSFVVIAVLYMICGSLAFMLPERYDRQYVEEHS
ncbi:Tetracycline resistance protein, class G [Porphyridium purpureum]|uniref:Tetracycline resistance protein, class G n=1 Tax=Porphyridium purpureum TaxID=35688 RepID=A0A5J4Z2W0_PORPP|nr:Tetracycline resistance protein, class G [Porphyridium purpureum]|eukprot:POR7269..scf295_1